jgi:predicted transcriptional regulator
VSGRFRVGHTETCYQRSIEKHRPLGIVSELRQARINKGIGQYIMCEKIGLAKNILSRWECGQVQPGLFNLQAWANALGKKLALEDL